MRLRRARGQAVWAAVALAVMLGAGCSGLASIGAGYVSSPSGRPGRQGGGLNAYYGGGLDSNAGMSLGLRTKFTEQVQHAAISVDGYLMVPTDSPALPILRLGVNALQFEGVEEHFVFGMFSPFAELGLAFLTDWVAKAEDATGIGDTGAFGGPFVSVTASAEYLVRFSAKPNAFWWGVYLNWGIAFGMKGL